MQSYCVTYYCSVRQVLKAYHLIDPRDDCQDLKIEVTIVKGKVVYTGENSIWF